MWQDNAWNVIVKQPFTPARTTQGLAKQNCLQLFLQISFTGEINGVSSVWLYTSFEAYTVAVAHMAHFGFFHHAVSYMM
jgi:hypothetical protein